MDISTNPLSLTAMAVVGMNEMLAEFNTNEPGIGVPLASWKNLMLFNVELQSDTVLPADGRMTHCS